MQNTTAQTPYRKVAFTPAQQATYLKQIWNLPVVKGGRIPLVMWFQGLTKYLMPKKKTEAPKKAA